MLTYRILKDYTDDVYPTFASFTQGWLICDKNTETFGFKGQVTLLLG